MDWKYCKAMLLCMINDLCLFVDTLTDFMFLSRTIVIFNVGVCGQKNPPNLLCRKYGKFIARFNQLIVCLARVSTKINPHT